MTLLNVYYSSDNMGRFFTINSAESKDICFAYYCLKANLVPQLLLGDHEIVSDTDEEKANTPQLTI